MIKKLINRYKAKQEHKNRITSPTWDLQFNNHVEQVKAINKQILLNNLMEVTNTSPNDIIAICNLDRTIEDGRINGMITELYTKPEGY